jgi:large subunit ribosomal protein L15
MPLARRVPKSGFINPFKVTYVGINLSAIQKGIDAGKLNSDVTIEGLINAGLLHKGELVKILGQGDLKGAVRFKVNAWSASAEEKIRAAGGSIETVQ